MKKLDDASRASAAGPTKKRFAVGLQFAEDLMRLRRDRRNYQQVVAWMERINLVRSEHSRELSRANKSLYEFLHPDEGRPGARPGDQSRGDQSRRARLDRAHQRSARPRHESRVALQHEPARAGEAHARRLWGRQGVHRRRRDHSGDLRARIDAHRRSAPWLAPACWRAKFWRSPATTTRARKPPGCRRSNWASESLFRIPRRRCGWTAIRAS